MLERVVVGREKLTIASLNRRTAIDLLSLSKKRNNRIPVTLEKFSREFYELSINPDLYLGRRGYDKCGISMLYKALENS